MLYFLTWPTEVAPCLFESLLLSGARIKETCAKYGIGNPSAYQGATKRIHYQLLYIGNREKSNQIPVKVTLYINACLKVFGKCSSALKGANFDQYICHSKYVHN